jgi:uncharacterized membrane protein
MKGAIPAAWDEARRSFWLLPAIGLTVGVALGFGMPAVDSIVHIDVPLLSFKQPQAARTLLQTMATASLSVAGVAFSVTVVAFQLASQQLSPRVLRTFQADRLSQLLLATFLGLFVYSLIVLARLPSARGATVPGLSLTVAIAQAVVALALFAAFIHNVVISLQASTLIRRIAADGHRAIAAGYPSTIGAAPSDIEDAERQVRSLKDREQSVLVRASRAGFLTSVRRDDLLAVTRKHSALVEQRLALGDFALTGAVLAEVWASSDHQDVAEEVTVAFEFGDERTVVQDVAFPIRQLADIALRGLSPALNDPTTAENAMDSLADTLVVFVRRERPAAIRCDDDGTPRFVAIAPTLDDLVRLGFDQVRRASRPYPMMASRLLTLLEHIEAIAKENDADSNEIGRQKRLLRDAARGVDDAEEPLQPFEVRLIGERRGDGEASD